MIARRPAQIEDISAPSELQTQFVEEVHRGKVIASTSDRA
jgi:hypothetical protein